MDLIDELTADIRATKAEILATQVEITATEILLEAAISAGINYSHVSDKLNAQRTDLAAQRNSMIELLKGNYFHIGKVCS